MGGCAMIGQTVINLSSGGRGRLSGVVAGVMILLFILFLSPFIERIPLAALVGVMFVVAQQTFAWASLRVVNKVPLNDVLVIVAVTVITVFTRPGHRRALRDRRRRTQLRLAASPGTLRRQPPGGRRQQALSAAWHSVLCFDGALSQSIRPGQRPGPGDPRLPSPELRRLLGHCRLDDPARALREGGKQLHVFHLSERCKRLLKRAGAHQ